MCIICVFNHLKAIARWISRYSVSEYCFFFFFYVRWGIGHFRECPICTFSSVQIIVRAFLLETLLLLTFLARTPRDTGLPRFWGTRVALLKTINDGKWTTTKILKSKTHTVRVWKNATSSEKIKLCDSKTDRLTDDATANATCNRKCSVKKKNLGNSPETDFYRETKW